MSSVVIIKFVTLNLEHVDLQHKCVIHPFTHTFMTLVAEVADIKCHLSPESHSKELSPTHFYNRIDTFAA